MTTPLVPSITDEQLADLEKQCEKFAGFAVSSKLVEQLISRLRAAERDAGRYRFIRSRYHKVGFLSCDSQKAKYFDEYMICGERMDDAIDAAHTLTSC